MIDVFISLNAIRILSIIAMLLVFSSNIVTLSNDVKAVNRFMDMGKRLNGTTASNATIETETYMDYITYAFIRFISRIQLSCIMAHRGSTVPNQPAGAFWAVLNRLFIIAQVVVLILSEFGFPAKFFNVYFPVLGKDFGLGALGLIQMLYVLHSLC